MITFRQFTLRRGARILLDRTDLTIHAGQRVGMVGPNGAGKSSLFAAIRGELHADQGELDFPARLVIAHVAQETPGVEASALDYVLDGDEELRVVERDLREAEQTDDGERLALAHDRYDAVGGYAAAAKAARLLSGLGFPEAKQRLPVKSFSGGWRMRLNLARALMCRSDLLLLDEPTNHLDLDAVMWLEQWLKAYRGTLMLISHDREFLDGVVSHICHFDEGKLRLYTGGYSDFERQRLAVMAEQQAAHEKQQREMAHLQSFVDRFRAKATKARQAQSRLKALSRMEPIAAARAYTPFQFSLRTPETMPATLLRFEDASVGYDGRPVISDISLIIENGARIGLLGRNGAGKSTLIRLIAGVLQPLGGVREEGRGLRVGYFAQHQLEHLHGDLTPLQHLVRLDGGAREQELRDFLGGFNFHGTMADAVVGTLSGGEKARLALALIVWLRPNLLVLDEPTNHLDIEMRDALTWALQDYEGGLIVVSHDRHLLRTTTDSFWRVADGSVTEFDGTLEDYAALLASGEPGSANMAAKEARNVPSQKEIRRQEAERRNQLAAQRRPLERQIRDIEEKMAALEARKAQLDSFLADSSSYDTSNKTTLTERLREQGEVSGELHTLEERWLALQEELEALDARTSVSPAS